MKKVNMGFLLFLLGGFFLWNPIVGVKDILPDAIGYFMLCMGLLRFADLNDDLAEAQKAFRSMLWVSLAYLAAWGVIFGFLQKTEMDMNQYEEPVWVLVFALAFVALELYLMFPAWKLFFKGLSDLAEYHGGSAILADARGRLRCERMVASTRSFLVIKAVLTVLPEASVLTTFQTEENALFFFDWFPYLSAFRTVAVLIGLVVGLIWFFDFCRLMKGAMGDKPWQARLAERYEAEILPDVGLLLNRRIKDAFSFFKVGIFFCINLTMQYHEILPDWISVILFVGGGLLLGKLLARVKPALISGGALLIVGILKTYFNEAFLKDEWTPEAALMLPSVADRYFVIRVLSWVEAAATLVFVFFVLQTLFDMAKRHTSIHYGGDADLSERATARLHTDLWRRSLWALLAFGVSSMTKILEVELQPVYGWIWLVQVGCSALAVGLFDSCLNHFAEAIADRYPAKRRA